MLKGDGKLLRREHKQLKRKITESMEVYRKKLENKLQQNNERDV